MTVQECSGRTPLLDHLSGGHQRLPAQPDRLLRDVLEDRRLLINLRTWTVETQPIAYLHKVMQLAEHPNRLLHRRVPRILLLQARRLEDLTHAGLLAEPLALPLRRLPLTRLPLI